MRKSDLIQSIVKKMFFQSGPVPFVQAVESIILEKDFLADSGVFKCLKQRIKRVRMLQQLSSSQIESLRGKAEGRLKEILKNPNLCDNWTLIKSCGIRNFEEYENNLLDLFKFLDSLMMLSLKQYCIFGFFQNTEEQKRKLPLDVIEWVSTKLGEKHTCSICGHKSLHRCDYRF